MNWKIGKYPSVIISDTKIQNENFPRLLTPAESPDSDIENYGGYMVCESIGNKQHAHLISAAPEMYETLKMVLEKYRDKANFWNTDLTKIYEALAKAEGREIEIDN